MSEETLVLLEDNMPAFEDVVRHLAKSETLLVEEFSEAKAGVLHMGIGMITEARELVNALFAHDRENVKEEIGDYLFYSVGLRQALEDHYDDVYVKSEFPPIYDVAGFLLQTMNVIEFIKPDYVYNRELAVPTLYALLDELDSKVQAFADNMQLSLEECLNHTREKLWTKRYPEGYSDQAANDRSDKADEQK